MKEREMCGKNENRSSHITDCCRAGNLHQKLAPGRTDVSSGYRIANVRHNIRYATRPQSSPSTAQTLPLLLPGPHPLRSSSSP
eukprot:1558394-Rhodomonas_salina.2